jgi:hypothetical protein
MNWSERCLTSIRKEKADTENRYGIRIGQTEIYCARCGKSWGYGNHTCQDVRLSKLKEAKKGASKAPKTDVTLSQDDSRGLIASSSV